MVNLRADGGRRRWLQTGDHILDVPVGEGQIGYEGKPLGDGASYGKRHVLLITSRATFPLNALSYLSLLSVV